MNRIRPLDAELRDRLRSGVAATSVAQCVEELILNSVDAKANCVAVRVDLSAGQIQVVDNGEGISRDNMEMVCQRYATSKCHNIRDLDNLGHYGYRGEALASIRDTSLLLEVTSRHKLSTETYTRIFRTGQPLAVQESATARASRGTTVMVHDVFHSLPVRKKHMNESLELERLRMRVEAAALIHPLISFSLRNDANGTKLLQTHKSNGVVGSFGYLFGGPKTRQLKEVEAEGSGFKATGMISTDSHHSKALQFMYINKRLVLKTKFHKLINYLLGKSLIIKKRGHGFSPDTPRDPTRSPQKYSDRHGVYVLDIKCPLSAYDITFDPAKTLVEFKDWSAVLKVVEDMVQDFILKQNLTMKLEVHVPNVETKILDEEEACNQATNPEEGKADDISEDASSTRDYSKHISTVNMVNTRHSEAVRRQKLIPATQGVEVQKTLPTFESDLDFAHSQSKHDDWLPPGAAPMQAAQSQDCTFPQSDSTLNTVTCSRTQDASTLESPLQILCRNTPSDVDKSVAITISSNDDESPTGSKQISHPTNIADSLCSKVESISQILKPECMYLGQNQDLTSACEASKRDRTFISLPTQMSSSLQEFRKMFKQTPLSEEPIPSSVMSSMDQKSSHSRASGPNPWDRIRQALAEKQSSLKASGHIHVESGNQRKTTDEYLRQSKDKEVIFQDFALIRENIAQKSSQELADCPEFESTLGPSAGLFSVESDGERQVTGDTIMTKVNADRPAKEEDLRNSAPSDWSRENCDSTEISESYHSHRTGHEAIPCTSDDTLHNKYQNIDSCITAGEQGCLTSLSTNVPDKQISNFGNEQNNTNENSLENSQETSIKKQQQFSSHFPLHLVNSRRISNCHPPEGIANQSGAYNTSSSMCNNMDIGKSRYNPLSERDKKRDSLSRKLSMLAKTKTLSAVANSNTVCNNLPLPVGVGVSTFQPAEVSESPESSSGGLDGPVAYLTTHGFVQTAQDLGLGAGRSRPSTSKDPPLNPHDSECHPGLSDTSKTCAKNTGGSNESGVLKRRHSHCVFNQESESDALACGFETVGDKQDNFAPLPKHHKLLSDLHDLQSACAEITQLTFQGHEAGSAESTLLDSSGPSNMRNHSGHEGHFTTQDMVGSHSVADQNAESCTDPDISLMKHCSSNVCATEESPISEGDVFGGSPAHAGSSSCHTSFKVDDCGQIDKGTFSPDFHYPPFLLSNYKTPMRRSTDATGHVPRTHADSSPTRPEAGLDTGIQSKDQSNISIPDILPSYSRHANSQGFNCTSSTQRFGQEFSNTQGFHLQPSSTQSFESAAETDCLGEPQSTCSFDNPGSDDACYTVNDADMCMHVKSTNTYGAHKAHGNISDSTPSQIKCSSDPELNNSSQVSIMDGGRIEKLWEQDMEPLPTECKELSKIDGDEESLIVRRHERDTKPQLCEGDAAKSCSPSGAPCNTAAGSAQWVCQVDKTGRKTYIHLVSGNTSYSEPKLLKDNLTRTDRVDRSNPMRSCSNTLLQEFKATVNLPRPAASTTLSPSSQGHLNSLFEGHQGDTAKEEFSKWREHKPQHNATLDEETTSIVQLFADWDNPVCTTTTKEVLSIGTGQLSSKSNSIQKSLLPCTFTKQMLQSIKVLGQMDQKFIPCLIDTSELSCEMEHAEGGLLVVIDQHAAHERVRLENLIAESYEERDGDRRVLCRTVLVPPVVMTLTTGDVRVLEAYRLHMRTMGLEFSTDNNQKDTIHIDAVPTGLVQREPDVSKRGRTPIARQIIETFIKEQTDLLKRTNGANTTLPKTIMRVLAAQACHGAIKFGDRLTPAQCEQLVASLAECDLPFQCAHGRPSIMPLVDLHKLHHVTEPRPKPRIWRLAQKMQTSSFS